MVYGPHTPGTRPSGLEFSCLEKASFEDTEDGFCWPRKPAHSSYFILFHLTSWVGWTSFHKGIPKMAPGRTSLFPFILRIYLPFSLLT